MFNVMMLRHSAGFEHSYLPHAEVALKALGRETGLFNVITTHQCQRITEKSLEPNHLLIFATTGELPFDDDQKKAILGFVRDGKAFLGIHNATDTCYQWPEYGEMLGGWFCGHPWTQTIRAKVEDADHPATRHLAPGVTFHEEVYTFKNWDRKRTRVLMSVDNTSVDLAKGNRPDHDYALAWCHTYGKGRVMYTALGHPDELWSIPWFRQHILGCVKWALGIEA